MFCPLLPLAARHGEYWWYMCEWAASPCGRCRQLYVSLLSSPLLFLRLYNSSACYSPALLASRYHRRLSPILPLQVKFWSRDGWQRNECLNLLSNSIREFSPASLPIIMIDKDNSCIMKTLEEVRTFAYLIRDTLAPLFVFGQTDLLALYSFCKLYLAHQDTNSIYQSISFGFEEGKERKKHKKKRSIAPYISLYISSWLWYTVTTDEFRTGEFTAADNADADDDHVR